MGEVHSKRDTNLNCSENAGDRAVQRPDGQRWIFCDPVGDTPVIGCLARLPPGMLRG